MKDEGKLIYEMQDCIQGWTVGFRFPDVGEKKKTEMRHAGAVFVSQY